MYVQWAQGYVFWNVTQRRSLVSYRRFFDCLAHEGGTYVVPKHL
jgi:hypothetical protein